GTVAKGHTIQANYIRDTDEETRLPFDFSIDPNVAEHPSFPNRLFVSTYNGVLTSKLLATFQVSQKKEGFRGSGGFDPDIHASPRGGSHDIKRGIEHLTSNQTRGNSQSASGFVFDTDYLPGANGPAYDGSGRIIPTFTPGVSQLENWLATRGAKLDIRTL